MKFIPRFIVISVFCVLVLALPDQVGAQGRNSAMQLHPTSNMLIRQMDIANNLFALQTRAFIYPGMYDNKYFNIYKYQQLYSQTPQYDPLGVESKDKLYQYAYRYEHAQKEADKAQALANFRELLEAHMGHFGIVTAAIALIEEEEALYDIAPLRRMRALMIKRLMNSGSGNTVRTAYKVYTALEETYIFLERNAELLETESLVVGLRAYNIHRVVNQKTGEAESIYVNVSAVREKEHRDEILHEALVYEQKPDPEFDLSPLD